MPTHNLARTVARDAARLAGQLCLLIRGEMLRNRSYMEKAGNEPVTIADYGSQAVVLNYIHQRFPDDGTMAEEGAADFERLATNQQKHQIVHYVSEILGKKMVSVQDLSRMMDIGKGGDPRRMWVVDPIDGTKGFLRGDQFAIAVALLVDGEPMVGALACPVLAYNPEKPDQTDGIVMVAARGEAVIAEPLRGGHSRPVRVSSIRDMAQVRVVESVESGHTDHEFHETVMGIAGIKGEKVRIDSQAKYVAVADGRAEVYIRHSRGEDYRERAWDHAAGALIVQQAGGKVTDLNGNPLDFSTGERMLNNTGILATNSAAVHDAVLEAIQQANG